MRNDSPQRKVVAIAQARMGSARLPNKMMLHLHGFPIVEWVYRRASKASTIDALVFAIPDTSADDALAIQLLRAGATIFRGSEKDVLSRFYLAAIEHGATDVMRICCDNPLVSPLELDNLVNFYSSVRCDYAYNHIPRGNSYPDGLGAEISSFAVLETMFKEAVLPSHREHVFNFLWENQERFVTATFNPPDVRLQRPEIRLDVDTEEDYCRLLQMDITPELDGAEIMCLFGERQ